MILILVIGGGLKEDPMLDRYKDQGAGAVTSYHDFTFIAQQHVKAGQELFAEASDSVRSLPLFNTSWYYYFFLVLIDLHWNITNFVWQWFRDRESESDGEIIPLASDYQVADLLVQDLLTYKESHPDLSESAFLDILLRIKTEMVQEFKAFKILLPGDIEEVEEMAEKGTARTMLNEHTIEWVEKNGTCKFIFE